MNIIVAVDKNWGIGKNGNLLFRISEDLKFFKAKTVNKIVIMGRLTFETLPNQKPLKDRINIILTKQKNYELSNAKIVESLEILHQELKKYNTDDIYIIGGESIYKELLNYCTNAYVTKINEKYDADKYMPNLDLQNNWSIVNLSQNYFDKNGVQFSFVHYQNQHILK